ncbi:zwei Ig domain protein zig-8-like isoform X2 [Bradysia coprophila]|uniref:zwei Ig domain protein zig-8-like isoform X2 n=1 Tax=Bradysia coprophila TaxID=38358 RepID=UPI00187D8839|nr:zwei Ig domain protein zig-8-like isoform X2 [Bradysia coprophila]
MASARTIFVLLMETMLFFGASYLAMGAQRESSKPKEYLGTYVNNGAHSKNNIEIEEPRNGPYFDKSASKNVTALLGKTAYLNCRVKNLGNKTTILQVSWVRHRDIHLLTVGRYTYTSDQRFRALHHPHSEDWILQIKYPQHRDSGIYECQVSTSSPMSHYIHLNVIEPSTEIIGAPDLYIESGSTINLTCVILNSPEPPAYIFWNHNNAIITYESPRGGVSVLTKKDETTTSFLLIKNARPSDSGQYQCNPSNAKSKSVMVHVLNGEYPAAMQRAARPHHPMSSNHYLFVCISVLFSTWFLAFANHYKCLRT